MNYLTAAIMALLAAAVVFSGCTGGPSAPMAPAKGTISPAAPGDPPMLTPDLAGDWSLTAMGIQAGSQVINPIPDISLSVYPAMLAGNDGCSE